MLAVVLVILGIAMRVLPHEANFTPIAAIALFGAVYLKPKHALILPLAALLASDVIIGFDSLESRLTVYGSFILIGLIGLLIRRRKSVLNVILGSLAGSVIFYLVTNFVLFYPPTMYAHNFSGVISSYINAVPFFRNTVLGDLFFTGLLFGSYELVQLIVKKRSNLSLSR